LEEQIPGITGHVRDTYVSFLPRCEEKSVWCSIEQVCQKMKYIKCF